MATEMDTSEARRTGNELLDLTLTGGDGVVVDEAATNRAARDAANPSAEEYCFHSAVVKLRTTTKSLSVLLSFIS